jgi:hypothetical protein
MRITFGILLDSLREGRMLVITVARPPLLANLFSNEQNTTLSVFKCLSLFVIILISSALKKVLINDQFFFQPLKFNSIQVSIYNRSVGYTVMAIII